MFLLCFFLPTHACCELCNVQRALPAACPCVAWRGVAWRGVAWRGVATADEPSLRLCIMHTWPDFQGYGFNLHAEKGKPGQFIGKVDEDSPAEAAGLRDGDRIVEVNGVSVVDETHAQVVTRIKSVPNLVKMLVIDTEGEQYYKERGIPIHGGMRNVIVGEARERGGATTAAVEPPREPTPEPEPVVAAVHVVSNQGNQASILLYCFGIVQCVHGA